MMQPSKSSNFLNMEVWVYSETGSWNITDNVSGFSFHNSRNFMHQKLNLVLKITSEKLKNTKIGFFKERYVVIVELFDISQNQITDKILFDTKVIKYNDLDMSAINQDYRPDNTKDIIFSIDLLNSYEEGSYRSVNKVLENTTYKNVVSFVEGEFSKYGVFKKDKDPCAVPYPGNFEQFFIPTMKLYNALPYVINKGYSKPEDVIGAYFVHDGYCIYRFEKSKNRKKIKTTIYPSRSQLKDFKEIFVKDFTIFRDPGIYLRWGVKNPIFEISEYRHRFHAPWFADPKITNDVFIPKLYPDTEGLTMETDYDIRSNPAVGSYFEKYRSISLVKLYLTRWEKFEWLFPVRHPYELEFTHESMKYLSDTYFVSESKVVINRQHNEFVPGCELMLQIYDIR